MQVPQTEPWECWPSGGDWTVGILVHSPEWLSQRLGIRFQEVPDDLGPMLVAALPERSVGQLWLVRHVLQPSPGTDVQVDVAVERDEAIGALWHLTGLDIRAFRWVNPFPAHPWRGRFGHTFGVPDFHLTKRESEIVELLGSGAEPPAIARKLGIQQSTLRTYLSKLRLKFRAADNSQLRKLIVDSRPRPPAIPA